MKKAIIFILIVSTVMLSADVYSMGNPEELNNREEYHDKTYSDGLSRFAPHIYGALVPPFAADQSTVIWIISGIYYIMKNNPNWGNGFSNMPPTKIWFAGCTVTYILSSIYLYYKVINTERYKYDEKARKSFSKSFRISTFVTFLFLIAKAALYSHYIGDDG